MAAQETILQHGLQTLSTTTQKKSKPPPLVISSLEAQYWPLVSPLAEFAAIATSPESPLVKEISHDNWPGGAFKLPSVDKVSLSSSDVHTPSHDTHPLTLSTSSIWDRLQDTKTSQENDLNSVPDSRNTSVNYSALQGDERLMDPAKTSSLFRPHTLKDAASSKMEPWENGNTNFIPWSKYYTTEYTSCQGLPRHELLLGDVRFPLSSTQEQTTQNENISSKTQEKKHSVLYDLDSAAQALSNMAKRKEEHDEYQRKLQSTLQIVKRKGTRTRKRKNASSCARRPMNAFMLFAKRYRLEITRKHPGKDNRAISVILGDQWKSLSSEDRKGFIVEAKYLAEEHKKIYPDCWKRKRSSKVASRKSRKH